MNKVDVLDHGFIRLVDHMGSDLSVVRSARVSYDADWRAGEDDGKDEKLIGYLLRHHHNTPFESVVFTFEVKAPIFVFRQWHRHRTQAFNEVSARYTELPEEYYVPAVDQITTQHATNKQMRSTERHSQAAGIRAEMELFNGMAFSIYRRMIKNGVARELARSILPVATYSRMFATVNLHNLMGFLRERLDERAQYEIRVYAEAIVSLIQPIVPVTMKYFKESLLNKL